MPPLPSVTKAFLLACVGFFCFFELFPFLAPWFELWPLNSGVFMPWQLVSYAFLHGSFTHLLFNMLGLWMFGGELERVWGPKRYTQILVASTLSAAIVQLIFTWVIGSRAPTVGASGAIFGLLLSFGMLFPNRIIVPLIPPIPMFLLSFVFEGPGAFPQALGDLTLRGGFSVLFTAYLSTVFGYGLWAILLGKYPANVVAPFTLLVPIFGIGFSLVLLGETISGIEVLGSVLVFAGLLVNVFGPRLLRRATA